MKKGLITFAALLFVCSVVTAQTLCVTASDQCCDVDASIGSATTTVAEANLVLNYNASNEDNQVYVEMSVDGVVVRDWTVCGCGADYFTYNINSGHLVSLKVLCQGCQSTTCVTGRAEISLYSDVSGITCKISCD